MGKQGNEEKNGYIMFVGAGLMNGVARNGNEKKQEVTKSFSVFKKGAVKFMGLATVNHLQGFLYLLWFHHQIKLWKLSSWSFQPRPHGKLVKLDQFPI